jgi:chromosome segregation ATPase
VKVGFERAAGELVEDCIEECIDHMMRCESLEKRLLCVESENKELRSRLSECSVLHERQCQVTKAEYEADTKRLRSVIQALKIDILQLQTASQEMVQNCRVKDELLKTAQQECRNLQSKLNAFASDLQPCSKVKVASEVAAAEERAALAVQAAEARAIQTKVSAAAEIQRCRSETERLVTELGEAKATINDYMWRCEAMQCSLINARHGLTSASEATAAAERRASADLEAANYRAQETQAAFEAEIRELREEVAMLREALAESNATVDKFIDHSCSLQEELELSQAESLNLFYYSLSRSGTSGT